MDILKLKKLYEVLSKITNVFPTDTYVFKHGYFITNDIEKPFIIQIDTKYIDYLYEITGEFALLKITDIKMFKKALSNIIENDKIREKIEKGTATDKDLKEELPITNYFYHVTDSKETSDIVELLTKRINDMNLCTNWEIFALSSNLGDNLKLILSLFKENDYVTFTPKDTEDGPPIILTKSLLPLVSEKNYTNLFYTSRKINDNLFLIIFDFQFDLFRLNMFHYYIPIRK